MAYLRLGRLLPHIGHSFHVLGLLPQDKLVVIKSFLVDLFVKRNNIHQEVKNVNFTDHLLDVSSLESFSVCYSSVKGSSMS